MDSTSEPTSDTSTPETTPVTTPQIKLTEVPIKDENTALNILIAFVDVAQKRGVYAIDESAKIWECIQIFMRPPAAQDTPKQESSLE